MSNRTAAHTEVKIKKATVKAIQSFFETQSPEEAFEKLAEWLKQNRAEAEFMRQHQGKGHFKKVHN